MRYICTSIVATLALAGTSFAATINVPGDYSTIQGAINVSSDGDTIAIAAGTYNEHSLNPSGKAITIGSASGNLDVTIDAQQGGGVFVINSGEGDGTVINDLVITGGSSSYGGGGIYCEDSNPTIRGCTIEGNTAYYYGGGIYCDSSNPTITDCTISGNEANYYAGGIYCWGSEPTISGCTIEGNTADYAGGIYSANSNPTITGSQICGNEPDQIYGSYSASGSCIEQSCDMCVDSDGDGVVDIFDQCPGEDDTIDTDSDGTPDCLDGCPDDPLKTEPGDCGCGELETDTDSDGTPDCIDGCPEDPLKTEPGFCGCGTPDTNVNGDVDCDGDYDIDDIYAGMEHFGIDEAGQCAGDTDGNGVVNIEDLLNMLGSWGACP